jgi:hypothetical protein
VSDDAGYNLCGSRSNIERDFQLELRSMIVKQARQYSAAVAAALTIEMDVDTASIVTVSLALTVAVTVIVTVIPGWTVCGRRRTVSRGCRTVCRGCRRVGRTEGNRRKEKGIVSKM